MELDKGRDIIRTIERINFRNINELRQIINTLENEIVTINQLLNPLHIDQEIIDSETLKSQRLLCRSIKIILEQIILVNG